MQFVYKNIDEYKPNRKRSIDSMAADMAADMLSKKKLNQIVTELFN